MKEKRKKKTLVGQVFDFANNCHFQFFKYKFRIK